LARVFYVVFERPFTTHKKAVAGEVAAAAWLGGRCPQ